MIRPLFVFGIGFILTALLNPLSFKTNITFAATMVILAIVAALFFIEYDKIRVNVRYFCVILLGIGACLITQGIYMQINVLPLLDLSAQNIKVTAIVCEEYTKYNNKNLLCKTKILSATGIPKTVYIEVKDYTGDMLKVGESFMGDINIVFPKSYKNIVRNKSQGIDLQGVLKGEPKVLDKSLYPITEFAVKTREYIKNNIIKRVDINTKGVALALATGDKSNIEDHVSKALSKSGTMHIATVSGMHMSIVTMSVLSILSFLGIEKRLAYFLTLGIPILFALICGFTPSTYRAMIMIIISLIGNIIFRKSDTLTSLAIGGIITLIINPFYGKSMSFAMTYLATMGIVILTPKLKFYFTPKLKNRLIVNLFNSLYQSLGAFVFLLLVTPFFFGYFNILSPITNMVCSVFTYPALVLSILTGFIPNITGLNILGELLGKLAGIFILPIIKISEFSANIESIIININTPARVLALGLVIIIIMVAILFKTSKASMAVLPLCCGIILFSAVATEYVLNKDVVEIISSDSYTIVISQGSGALIYLDSFPPSGNYANTALEHTKVLSLILAEDEELFKTTALSKVLEENMPQYILYNSSNLGKSYLKPYSKIEVLPLDNSSVKFTDKININYIKNIGTEIIFNDIILLKKSTEYDIINNYSKYALVLDKQGEVIYQNLPQNCNRYIFKQDYHYKFY